MGEEALGSRETARGIEEAIAASRKLPEKLRR